MNLRHRPMRLLILLIFLGMLLPLILLFKNYPQQIPCGKIVHVSSHLTVPINCDSSIFLQDADNSKRLFDGTSTYSDRPLPAIIVLSLDKFIAKFRIPDRRVQIKGNSGSLYDYSQRKYALFIFLNFLVLLSALIFALKTLKETWDLEKVSIFSILVAINAVLIIASNELIKTFFWTPHTQLFNILLPSFAFWEVGRTRQQMIRFRVIGPILIFISSAMFFYPIFCLAAIPVLFMHYKNLRIRMILISLAFLPYLSYPYFVRLFGGTYTNQQAYKFREFLWVFDMFTGKSSFHLFSVKVFEFFRSLPIFPCLAISALTFVYLKFFANKKINQDNIFNLQKTFILSYVLFLIGIGLGERRLTFGVILFTALSIFWRVSEIQVAGRTKRHLALWLSFLAAFQILSFITTLGPLK